MLWAFKSQEIAHGSKSQNIDFRRIGAFKLLHSFGRGEGETETSSEIWHERE
jgi:hypothetical protein